MRKSRIGNLPQHLTMGELPPNLKRLVQAAESWRKLSKICERVEETLSELDDNPELIKGLEGFLSTTDQGSRDLEEFNRLIVSKDVPTSGSFIQPQTTPRDCNAGTKVQADDARNRGANRTDTSQAPQNTSQPEGFKYSSNNKLRIEFFDSDVDEENYELTLTTLFTEVPLIDILDNPYECWDDYEITIEKLFQETPSDIRAFPSASEYWEHLKKTYRINSASFDRLMDMVGLEEVKLRLVEIAFRVAVVAVERGIRPTTEELSVVFTGSHRIGKTTVAELYISFLQNLKTCGLYPYSIKRISASYMQTKSIIDEYQLQPYLNGGDIYGVGPGVNNLIFIDDINELELAVIQSLATDIKRLERRTIFILAGHKSAIDDLLAAKAEIASSAPTIIRFPAFTEDELYQLFVQEMSRRFGGRAQAEESAMNELSTRILIKRISRERGFANGSNVQLVRDALDEVLGQQSARLLEETAISKEVDYFHLEQEDLIGPPPSVALEDCVSWRKLQKMIGLTSVKAAVKTLVLQLQWNYNRELKGLPPIRRSLNRLFLGNPGTGKTTVAKLYGKILADTGILSSSEVIEKTAADFLSQNIGGSEINTKAILNAARGKVLVIDEAYMLYGGTDCHAPDKFRVGIIDTLVGEIQSSDNEDRCVLLLGYRYQMEEMFRNTNPGLARRFPISSAFEFEDYTKEELEQILELKLAEQELKITDEGKEVAMEILERARNSPTFSNAGEIDILLDKAKERQQKRYLHVGTPDIESMQLLEAQDIDGDFDRADRAAAKVGKLFSGMVGSEALVKKFEGWQRIVKNAKSRGFGDPREFIPFNFLFRGPPGTGKTTTARKMGKIFYDLGFLATEEIIECSASDLIGEYIGHTGPKTRKVFEKALGKVLFIDEAYRLGNCDNARSFCHEAIGEIVDILTQERFRNKLVVILAGYDEDLNRLLGANPGLNSRFPEAINFENLTPAQCRELLCVSLELKQLRVRSEYHELIEDRFGQLVSLPFWGNARDVQTVVKEVVSKVLMADDFADDSSHRECEAALVGALEEMLSERRKRATRTYG